MLSFEMLSGWDNVCRFMHMHPARDLPFIHSQFCKYIFFQGSFSQGSPWYHINHSYHSNNNARQILFMLRVAGSCPENQPLSPISGSREAPICFRSSATYAATHPILSYWMLGALYQWLPSFNNNNTDYSEMEFWLESLDIPFPPFIYFSKSIVF